MATIRLIPSTYAVSSTSYLSVSNASNMYANTDSTNYATITNTNASTSSRYLYLRGFNFSSIPSDAVVSSFTVKIKGYESGLATSTSYAPRLANGTSALSNTTASTNFGTSAKTITIPTGSLTWDQIVNTYGSNFTIMVYVRRNSRNTTGYFYCYGAEIEVTYTIPVTYNVTVTNNTSTTVTANPSTVNEGESSTIIANTINGITITDNGTNITNQFTQHSGTTGEYTITNRGSYGFALSNGYYVSQNKGVDKSCAVCRVSFDLPVAATVTFTYINYAEASYDFGVFGNLDTELSTTYYSAGSNGATITDSSYKKACNTSSDNTSTAQTLTYSNVSAGSHYIDVKFSKDDGTSSNNDTLQFQVAITYNQSVSYYSYTISNIQTDHSIVVSQSQQTISVTGVTLNKNSTTLSIGDTEQLTATVTPSNATNKAITWSSSNTSIATVSSGLVTAVAAGSAIITVTTSDGGYTATCTVTVSSGEAVWTTIYESSNVEIIDSENQPYIWIEPYNTPFTSGETYRVTWGNDVYICQTFPYQNTTGGISCYDGYAIGNSAGTGSEYSHGEPFLLYRYNNSGTMVLIGATLSEPQSNFHLKIEKLTSGSITETLYLKISGSYVETTYTTVYKKVNGSWVEQSSLNDAFNRGTNYILVTT